MRFLLAFALALSLTACANDAAPDANPDSEPMVAGDVPVAGLVTQDAYARAAPAGGVSAVYIVIENGTSVSDTLVSVQTDAASRVEIHRTQDVGDGLSGMAPVEGGLVVPARETVTMEPNGLHVMLLDLQRDLADGDTLAVTLDFSSGATRVVRAPIRDVAGR